jgi:hypothetical protein
LSTCRIWLPPAQVDAEAEAGAPFNPDEHYFQVRIRELYLAHRQAWFATYDPLLLVITEFRYGSEMIAIPVVAGPALLQRQMRKAAGGLVFSNMRAAGWHPYRGGTLALSIVLCRVRRAPHSRNVLHLIEGASGALDFATDIPSYSQVADVVLYGIESLIGAGLLAPLFGFRRAFAPPQSWQHEQHFTAGYGALITLPETQLDTGTLYVREGRLVSGASFRTATPFRQADYALYQVARTSERDDVTTLPFYPLYERILRESSLRGSDSWIRARANRIALLDSLVQSLDLTPVQATALHAAVGAQMQQLHSRAVGV